MPGAPAATPVRTAPRALVASSASTASAGTGRPNSQPWPTSQPSRGSTSACLNLIAPWWKGLRALALAGRRFATWDEVCEAVDQARGYWNARRHPFVWGHRRRHRPRRQPGIALLPKAA